MKNSLAGVRRRAMVTVEAALVLPLILFTLAACLLFAAWLHDRVVISAHVQREQEAAFFPSRGSSFEDCTDQRVWTVLSRDCLLRWELKETLTEESYRLKAGGPGIWTEKLTVEDQADRRGSSSLDILRRVEQIRFWRKKLFSSEGEKGGKENTKIPIE